MIEGGTAGAGAIATDELVALIRESAAVESEEEDENEPAPGNAKSPFEARVQQLETALWDDRSQGRLRTESAVRNYLRVARRLGEMVAHDPRIAESAARALEAYELKIAEGVFPKSDAPLVKVVVRRLLEEASDAPAEGGEAAASDSARVPAHASVTRGA